MQRRNLKRIQNKVAQHGYLIFYLHVKKLMIKVAVYLSWSELLRMVASVWVEHWVWSMVMQRRSGDTPLAKCFLIHCENTLEDRSELLGESHRGDSTALNQRNEGNKTWHEKWRAKGRPTLRNEGSSTSHKANNPITAK